MREKDVKKNAAAATEGWVTREADEIAVAAVSKWPFAWLFAFGSNGRGGFDDKTNGVSATPGTALPSTASLYVNSFDGAEEKTPELKPVTLWSR